MARGKKTGGRDFQPGHKQSVGNRGPSLLPPELRAIRKKYTGTYIEAMLTKYMDMDVASLKDCANNESLSAFEMYLASGLAQGIASGDFKNMQFFIDRLIGKALEKKELEIGNKRDLGAIPRERLVELARDTIKNEVVEMGSEDEDSA